MSQFFPFHAIGFQCNPFRAVTDEEWVEIAVVPEQIRQVLAGSFDNLQILGEKGYGKTTTLLWIGAEKRQANHRAAYEYIPEGQDKFQTPMRDLEFFLLDEVQRLAKKERGRLLRQTKETSLILATHENLEPLFSAHKRPVATIYLHQTTPAHLRAIVNKRLTYFALDGTSPPQFSDKAVDFLWEKFGRNFRAVEQYLYEYFQDLIVPTQSESFPQFITFSSRSRT